MKINLILDTVFIFNTILFNCQLHFCYTYTFYYVNYNPSIFCTDIISNIGKFNESKL